MGKFVIQGGRPLEGVITPQGAKNEALQVLCAVLLTEEPVVISNVPAIRDVHRLMEILSAMGVEITPVTADTYKFQAKDISLDFLRSPEFIKLSGAIRASIMILGPLLGRFGKAYSAIKSAVAP